MITVDRTYNARELPRESTISAARSVCRSKPLLMKKSSSSPMPAPAQAENHPAKEGLFNSPTREAKAPDERVPASTYTTRSHNPDRSSADAKLPKADANH